MKKILLGITCATGLIMSASAQAQTAPAGSEVPSSNQQSKVNLPPTLIFPTQVVTDLYNYLGARPASETRRFLDMIDQCASLQIPGNPPPPSAMQGFCSPAMMQMQKITETSNELATLQTNYTKLQQKEAATEAKLQALEKTTKK